MTRPAVPTAAEREARRQALLDLQLEQLAGMVRVGLRLIDAVEAQVAGTGPKVVEGDISLSYGRLTRAVRLTMALQKHLLAEPEEKADVRKKAEPKETFVTWIEPKAERRQARRERVEQIVERILRAEARPEQEVEAVVREAAERLDSIAVYGDPANRPVSELVFEICRDLGLDPDWTVLRLQAWAKDELECGDVGWPLRDVAPPPKDWRGGWPPKPPHPYLGDQVFPSRLGPGPTLEDAVAAGWTDSS